MCLRLEGMVDLSNLVREMLDGTQSTHLLRMHQCVEERFFLVEGILAIFVELSE